MEKIVLGGIEKHQEDNAVTGHSQHGFMSGEAWLSNLISFQDKGTLPADQGKTVDVIFLDFSKAFHTVSHRILVDKLFNTQLGKHIRQSVSHWLMDQTSGCPGGWQVECESAGGCLDSVTGYPVECSQNQA
ncbi:rna-directed dna polymerase from mobile element jockey-like [Willisornis vidua]|uniref:Rna-directed dna polymerase from mobile element jockey-like n=1 Tax=Willisornis vidua TaxID=1566151 RepID=A0ABQ9CVD8_9PASS|nr:rna-directed dna polymerase from mobile element jockey-like [Willisornis vidua]